MLISMLINSKYISTARDTSSNRGLSHANEPFQCLNNSGGTSQCIKFVGQRNTVVFLSSTSGPFVVHWFLIRYNENTKLL